MRKCSRRAREYKLAYHDLATQGDGALKMVDIERVKRDFKSKRAAYDQDAGFIHELVAIAR